MVFGVNAVSLSPVMESIEGAKNFVLLDVSIHFAFIILSVNLGYSESP